MKTLVRADRPAPEPLGPRIFCDLRFAHSLMAQAMTKASWSRNEAWVSKFNEYLLLSCPRLLKSQGFQAALRSNEIALAFLASVAREDPAAKTRVKSAKRAVNFLRSLARMSPLDLDPCIKLLARSASTAVARTVRQSPAFHTAYVRAITSNWGSSGVWWKRQVALMAGHAGNVHRGSRR